MSPFDMFVLTSFLIATFKAVTDAISFWKESEELAAAHYRAVDAKKAASIKRQQSALTRRASNITPKHLPVPCRPARVPADRGARVQSASLIKPTANNKPRAIRTGLNNKANIKRTTAA